MLPIQSARPTTVIGFWGAPPGDPLSTETNPRNVDKSLPEEKRSSLGRLPQRYQIRMLDNRRVLTCVESPNVFVHVERGLTFSASAARKSPPCTIFLDGVAQSEPFLDLEKQIYNFDHHEACVRQFTLSTCEQVLVMILKKFDLRGRDWKVFANEPDLDTILAIWLLMNHVRMQQRGTEGFRLLNALVRLEGIIDAHGLEITELSGFPQGLMAKTRKAIDYLRADEVELKKQAVWEETDGLEYTASVLHKIDRLVYTPDDFVDFKDLKELARVEIGQNRIAVVVDADLGIYELESHLNRLYGESLGVAILKKDDSTYTLRRLDPFMPFDLQAVYRRLNDIDPGVRCRTDCSRWGGSSDIGGSPRGVGTQLKPDEIAKACRDAFLKTDVFGNIKRLISASATLFALTTAAALIAALLKGRPSLAGTGAGHLLQQTDILFFSLLMIFSATGVMVFTRRKIWLYGITSPSGWKWMWLMPVVVLAAAAGGAYYPKTSGGNLGFPLGAVYVFLVVPVAIEVMFRGLVHGLLTPGHPTQRSGSRWFFSYPAVASAVLYAVFVVWLVFSPVVPSGEFELRSVAEHLFAAFAFGLAIAFARERSQSLLPPIFFHAAAMTVFLL